VSKSAFFNGALTRSNSLAKNVMASGDGPFVFLNALTFLGTLFRNLLW
jgi:hypothetical protein